MKNTHKQANSTQKLFRQMNLKMMKTWKEEEKWMMMIIIIKEIKTTITTTTKNKANEKI